MLNPRLFLVAVIWGINFPVVKFALADFYPLSFTLVRFILAALFLIAVMLLQRESFFIAPADRTAVLKLGFVGITVYNLFFMYGLNYTTASNSALIIALSPLFAVLIQRRSGSERLSLRSLLGFLIAFAGVLLIIKSHSGAFQYSSREFWGDMLTLIASIAWALYTVQAVPLLQKYSPIKVTAYSMTAGSVLLLPFAFSEMNMQAWQTISACSWYALLFASIISGGVAFTLWYQGVKQIGVARTVVYHYVMPCAAVAVAVLFLGEQITMMKLAGGIAVLLGILLVQKNQK
ncbi:MAG: DMT family transporter [Nitrospirota bacterium]